MSTEDAKEGALAKTLSASHSGSADEANIDQDREEYENRDLDFRTIMAIIALACGFEAALLSFILPSNIITAINADIGPSGQANWIAQAWSLSVAVIQTSTGRISDIFGRRYVMIGGNVFGLVGCTIAARASSISMVIAGCSLMGVGAGAQQLAFACVSEVVPKKSRGRVLGLFFLSSIPGSTFGAVIAYAMVAHASWRWAFYLGMIVNSLAIVMVTCFYWPPGFLGLHPDGKTKTQQFKELDFIGLLLFAAGVTILLVGVSFGGNPYPWTSARVLSLLIVGGIILFICFPLWEVYSPAWMTKLCPPSIFRNLGGFTVPLITIFVSGMGFYSLQALWPQQVQLLFTMVPEEIGWFSMALGAGSTLGGIVIGIVFAKIKHTKWQFITAIIVQTLFIGLMATVDQHARARAIPFVTLAGIAIGVTQVVGILTVQFGVPDRDIGVATGITGTARTMGGAFAIAIYSAVLKNKVAKDLGPKVAVAAVGAGLSPSALEPFIVALTSGSESALSAVKGVTPVIIAAGADAVKTVYSDAFKLTYLVSLAFGGVAVIASLFVKSVDDKLTNQVAVQLQKPSLKGNQEISVKEVEKA